MITTWSGVGPEASRLLVGVVRGCGEGCLDEVWVPTWAWVVHMHTETELSGPGHGPWQNLFHSALRRELSPAVRPLAIG